jgi:hypothetical protein
MPVPAYPVFILDVYCGGLLVLQPQIGWQSGQTTTVVGLFGPKLVLSPPGRPGQDKGREWKSLPQQVPEQAPYFTDRQWQRHQEGRLLFFVLQVGWSEPE